LGVSAARQVLGVSVARRWLARCWVWASPSAGSRGVGCERRKALAGQVLDVRASQGVGWRSVGCERRKAVAREVLSARPSRALFAKTVAKLRRAAGYRLRASPSADARLEDGPGAEQAHQDQRDCAGHHADAECHGSRRTFFFVDRVQVLCGHRPRRWRLGKNRRPPVRRWWISARRPRILWRTARGRRRWARTGGRTSRFRALPVRVVIRDTVRGTHVHRRYSGRLTTARAARA
jgi:hypothetical protein